MEKKRLDVDTLMVESFATAAAKEPTAPQAVSFRTCPEFQTCTNCLASSCIC